MISIAFTKEVQSIGKINQNQGLALGKYNINEMIINQKKNCNQYFPVLFLVCSIVLLTFTLFTSANISQLFSISTLF